MWTSLLLSASLSFSCSVPLFSWFVLFCFILFCFFICYSLSLSLHISDALIYYLCFFFQTRFTPHSTTEVCLIPLLLPSPPPPPSSSPSIHSNVFSFFLSLLFFLWSVQPDGSKWHYARLCSLCFSPSPLLSWPTSPLSPLSLPLSSPLSLSLPLTPFVADPDSYLPGSKMPINVNSLSSWIIEMDVPYSISSPACSGCMSFVSSSSSSSSSPPLLFFPFFHLLCLEERKEWLMLFVGDIMFDIWTSSVQPRYIKTIYST